MSLDVVSFVCLQFFVKLQYHKHQLSMQSALHHDRQLGTEAADNDDVMQQDDATRTESSIVDASSKSEASYVCFIV